MWKGIQVYQKYENINEHNNKSHIHQNGYLLNDGIFRGASQWTQQSIRKKYISTLMNLTNFVVFISSKIFIMIHNLHNKMF